MKNSRCYAFARQIGEGRRHVTEENVEKLKKQIAEIIEMIKESVETEM